MPKTFKNPEYIDWIREGQLLTDTTLEGTDRVTEPFKMKIRDMGLFIYGIFDGATVVVEASPDEMETRKEDLVPSAMRWYSRPDGTFTVAGATVQSLWENIDAAEGWFRIRVADFTGTTDISVKTRPRVEFSMVS